MKQSRSLSMLLKMLIKLYNLTGRFIQSIERICTKEFYSSERRNMSHSRDRLLEEQNAAYLDSMRVDQEKVCLNKSLVFLSVYSFYLTRQNNVDEKRPYDVN